MSDLPLKEARLGRQGLSQKWGPGRRNSFGEQRCRVAQTVGISPGEGKSRYIPGIYVCD